MLLAGIQGMLGLDPHYRHAGGERLLHSKKLVRFLLNQLHFLLVTDPS
jgi:hypothetical protein